MIGLEAGWRLQVGALLVLENPRMVGSSHTDIPAMEEFSDSLTVSYPRLININI